MGELNPLEIHYILSPVLFVAILFAIIFRVCCNSVSSKKKWNGKEWIYGTDDIPCDKFRLGTFIGNAYLFWPFSRSLENGTQWERRNGTFAKLYAANKTLITVTSPELIQQLYKSTNFGHNFKSPFIYNAMKPFISNGLLVSSGEFWQRQRKTLMRTQSYSNLKAYMTMLNLHGQQFVNDLKNLYADEKPHQINETINVLFLRIICEMIVGYNVNNSPGFDEYHHNFQVWKACLLKRVLSVYLLIEPIWRLHPHSRKQDKAIKDMTAFAKQRIREHKERQHKMLHSPATNPETKVFRSVLDELVEEGVKEDQIVDEVNTMLFGGHETGASVIHMFCFSMALNPEIQKMCQEEIDGMFENPEYFQNDKITFEAVTSGLKYLERCINETMRLYPPVFMMFRQLESYLELNHNNKKYHLPAGVNVVVAPYLTHRNSEYFPSPEKFDPDRFLPEETAKRHACSFIPFSGGPRNCLGMKFAMMELKLVAAYLLRNFEISTTDKIHDIPLMPFVTLTPERDYTFCFHTRNNNFL